MGRDARLPPGTGRWLGPGRDGDENGRAAQLSALCHPNVTPISREPVGRKAPVPQRGCDRGGNLLGSGVPKGRAPEPTEEGKT